jgi:hypothetical protein
MNNQNKAACYREARKKRDENERGKFNICEKKIGKNRETYTRKEPKIVKPDKPSLYYYYYFTEKIL